MYLDSSQSDLEILVSSNSLSDYFNKQEYSDKVKKSISEAMSKVQSLQAKLTQEQADLTNTLNDEKRQQDQADADAAAAQQIVQQYQNDQAAYTAKVQANNAQAASLRAQQAAAMAARFGGDPGTGPACGGGYPAKWCERGQDTVIDSWGMWNRECVSYAAWAMAARGYYVPYGMGNANQWPSAAAAAGIPVNYTPTVGSVAIWYIGQYGHAMVVDAVNGNNVTVSQYNYGFNGTYSVMTVPANGFVYIHFR